MSSTASHTGRPAPRGAPDTWSFVLWAAVGCGVSIALLMSLTIGLLALVVAGAIAALLVSKPGSAHAGAGILFGVGLIALLIAFLNRGGPGDVCTHTATSSSCTTEWSPWPWLAVGAVLVAAGIAAFVASRRAHRP